MPRWAPPELISAAIAGPEASANQLIETIWGQCFTLATAVIGDWNLAQDATQEACIIVHRKISSLRSTAAFDSWLYRIVIRECSRIRRRHAGNVQTVRDHVYGPDTSAVMDVWRALDALQPDLREVTVLFYMHDLKSDDIARILGVPHATVRSRLRRARDYLRSLLGEYQNESTPFTNEAQQHA